MHFKSVTILIFATDEHDSLIDTVHSILSICNTDDIEKILIIHPENATPDCLSAISLLKSENPAKVDSLEQKRPFLGGAINDSKQGATSSHVILFSADWSIEMSFVPAMIEEEKRNPEGMVKASRWLRPGCFHNYSSVKKFFNRIAQAFLRLLFHSALTDFTNPAEIMPTAVFKAIDFKEKKAAVMLELVLMPVKMGVKVKEIPTEYYGREEGKSKNSFLQTVLYMRTALRVRFFTKVEKI